MKSRTPRSARGAHLFILLLLLVTFSAPAFAQGDQPQTVGPPPPSAASEQKAQQIVERAIEKLGGSAYLNVRSLSARGYFTLFKDGVSGLPLSFIDYIVYPDRERTEFK